MSDHTVEHLRIELAALLGQAVEIEVAVNNLLKGRRVEVISDFNDQPHGRSRPSLKGKQYTIRSADMDTGWSSINLWLDGCQCATMLWTDVVLLP